ncbi:MAG: aminopeptidase [Chloroflexota bacterium]
MSSNEWPIQQFHYVPSSSSIIEMMRGTIKVVQQCAAVQPGEKVVISTDTNKIRIAEALAGAVHAVGGIPVITVIVPTGAHGAQLPSPVVAACRDSDVFFLPATFSQTHTDARIEAIKAGARGCTMCEITEDCFCGSTVNADFEQLDKLGHVIGASLAKTHKIRCTTDSGTDIVAEVTGRPVQYETGLFRRPREFAAFPNSEINIAPIEGTAHGKAVVDVRVMNIGVVKNEPVTCYFEKGELVEIEGGPMAKAFEEMMAGYGDRTAYNVAEFGVGLNKLSRVYATNLEDLGRLGNFHIGLGSNYAIGGKVKAPCHVDISFRHAKVEFDDKLVYDDENALL